MTREDIQTEIDHLTSEIERKKYELANADGALQAFRYMLAKVGEPAPAAVDVVDDTLPSAVVHD